MSRAPTRRGLARSMAVAFLVVLVADRATKLWVVEGLDLPALGRIDVFPPWLVLLMAWNPGVNFGLLGSADARWALVALAVVLSLGVVGWAWRRGRPAVCLGAAVLAGGAIGNAWDRVQYGAVADFLNMSCCGIVNPFAFNVADVAIFAGAIVIAVRA